MGTPVATPYQTAKKERIAYCLFFLGQNILWGYAGYVRVMARCNNGEISRQEAEALLADKFGPAGEA